MGDLGAYHELLADRYDPGEFEDEVASVQEAFFGLLDEEAAAMYVAAREGRLEPRPEDEILAGRTVSFDAEVRRVQDVRTFEKGDGEGKVLNVVVDTGEETLRLVFWDEDATRYASLGAGEQVHVEDGFVKDGRYGLEVHIDQGGELIRQKGSMPDDAEVGPAGDVSRATRSDLTGVLEDRSPTRTFERDSGDVGFVADVIVETDEKTVEVTLWDEAVRQIQEIPLGDPVEIEGLRRQDGKLHSTEDTQVVSPGSGSVSLDAFAE